MSDRLAKFNQYYAPYIIEEFGYLIDKFNAASNGTIVLTKTGDVGSFVTSAFLSSMQGSHSRISRNGTNDAVGKNYINSYNHTKVKLAGRFGPNYYEPGDLGWLQEPDGKMVGAIARSFAEAMLADQLNTAINAAVAAMNAKHYDCIATPGDNDAGVINQQLINKGHAKFGDGAGRLCALVMSSNVEHRLISQNLDNDSKLFTSDTVRIIDVLGRPCIITDAPALMPGGIASNEEIVLSLQKGAITIADAGQTRTAITDVTGNERLEVCIQSEYDFTLSLMGYSWDKTKGESPSDELIANKSSWEKSGSNIKSSLGVLIVGGCSETLGEFALPQE